MAGLYVHIPFCKSRCVYCDFCSSTFGADVQRQYVEALLHEAQQRRTELPDTTFQTLYFGGGTPSVLPDELLGRIIKALHHIFSLAPDSEITLEANPDDVSPQHVQRWCELGINRLSMGVQTLDDEALHYLHRRHSARQARQAVWDAVRNGLTNVSIDLMYGLPHQTLDAWQTTLQEALSLPVTHLSAYCLSVEEHTPLAQQVERREVSLPADDVCAEEYNMLVRMTREAGFRHYEISNFCRPDFASRHNRSYWDDTPYVGLGAGAHSYDGKQRRANTHDVKQYIELCGAAPFSTEILTHDEQINEYVFLHLRTRRGLSLPAFAERFGQAACEDLLRAARKHIDAGRLTLVEDVMRLTENGVFVSNDVMSDLMIVD